MKLKKLIYCIHVEIQMNVQQKIHLGKLLFTKQMILMSTMIPKYLIFCILYSRKK